MALVTVLTAARNAAPFLADALGSIAAQTLNDWEHIVVDDASTDDTAAVIRRHAQADARFRVLTLEKSVGSYQAANIGAEDARGEYIARLDADDMAEPRRLEVQIESLKRTGLAAGTGAWRAMDSDGSVEARVRTVGTHSNRVLAWRLFLRSGLVHSTLLMRRSSFLSLGGYGNRPVAEDYRIWGRLVRSGELDIVDEPLVRWRRHPGQVTAQPGARSQRDRLEVRVEHMKAMSTRTDWDEEDARDMWTVGERSGLGMRHAFGLLETWRRAWESDASTCAADREELTAIFLRTAAAHVRRNGLREPAFATWKAASLAGYAVRRPRAIVRALSR